MKGVINCASWFYLKTCQTAGALLTKAARKWLYTPRDSIFKLCFFCSLKVKKEVKPSLLLCAVLVGFVGILPQTNQKCLPIRTSLKIMRARSIPVWRLWLRNENRKATFNLAIETAALWLLRSQAWLARCSLEAWPSPESQLSHFSTKKRSGCFLFLTRPAAAEALTSSTETHANKNRDLQRTRQPCPAQQRGSGLQFKCHRFKLICFGSLKECTHCPLQGSL